MNIKELFLKLTEYTIPFGYEHTLEPLLPKGVKKDSIGNYYIEIGNSETLFTSHLDTLGDKYEKVNHVIEGDIVKTDGTTILGGDNKCGVVILSYLIEQGVPGTYYFFLGEEPPHGMYGSTNALKQNTEYFKKFKRVIAFDRKKDCSIITRQMAVNCCSDEFALTLKKEFEKYDLHFDLDKTGWYTDSAVFIKVIPEVTNISAGVWNEHSTEEFVDISILEKIAHAASKINWENLPTVREISFKNRVKKFIKKFDIFSNKKSDEILKQLIQFFSGLMYKCTDCDDFENGDEVTFSHWHEDIDIKLKIENGIIYYKDNEVGNTTDLIKYFGLSPKDYVDTDDLLEDLWDMIDKGDGEYILLNDKNLLKIIETKYFITLDDFVKLIKSDENLKEEFKVKNNRVYINL